MKSLVVYLSKTGNTKSIAEEIARNLQTKAISLNLLEKKGRGTPEERAKELLLFDKALNESKKVDFLVVGTPTGFQAAHSKIMRFIKKVDCSKIALFCTYYNKIGLTLIELENILLERKITVFASCAFDNLKSGQFAILNDKEKQNYLQEAQEFAKKIKEIIKEFV